MKKILYLLIIIVSFCTINAHAQVTIGSLDDPQEGAVLELKSDTLGFLPPRVALSQLSLPDPLSVHVQGMVVFNTTDNAADTLQAGLYYNSGSQWVRLSTVPFSMQSWFYMPSVLFDTSLTGTGLTKDLYEEYKDQFTSPKATSDGAPSLFTLPQATDLYYYILDYDDAVFDHVSVNDSGLMTYDVISSATEATFLNIVFVTKPIFP